MRKQNQNRYKVIKKELVNGEVKLSIQMANSIHKAVNMICNLMMASTNNNESYAIYDMLTEDIVQIEC
jgi:hypothetical protein